MFINSIEIRELGTVTPSYGMVRGLVAFMTDTATIQVTCQAPALAYRTAWALRRRLVKDALRQLRRMPEFRSGLAEIRFSPSLEI